MGAPFFIVGLPRSGTNLVARMLSRHPQASVALDPCMPVFRAIRDAVIRHHGDAALRRRYPPGLPFQDYYFDPLAPMLLEAMLGANLDMPLPAGEIERLRIDCHGRASLESPEMGRRMGALQGRTHGEVLASLFAILDVASPGKQWIGCKEVWIEDFIPLLARALPACRFIAIERDPRAVVASLLAMAATDPSQAAHAPSYMRHWRKGIALNRRYQADPALAGRLLLMRYESLVDDPEGGARALCGFLGLDDDPAMFALSEDGWTGNSSYRHAGRDVYAESRDRWQTQLPAEIVAAIDYLCGPEMRLTPYAPATPPRLDGRVIAYLLRADRETGSWRSDSGDFHADLAGEVLRHALLEVGDLESESAFMLRRCFLFPEIHHAILHGDGCRASG
jgi:hypothetical protein